MISGWLLEHHYIASGGGNPSWHSHQVFHVKVTNLADEAFAMDSRRGDWAIQYHKERGFGLACGEVGLKE